MRTYALAVAVALTGRSACIHCGDAVSLHSGDVDRTTAGCYRRGSVIMTCTACNIRRGEPGTAAGFDHTTYAADVLRASLTVALPASRADMVKAYRASAPSGFASSPYCTD